MDQKRAIIDVAYEGLSIRAQCELLELNRSSYYLEPVESKEDFLLMRLIDEIYTAWPFYGSRRIAVELRAKGELVNRKKVQRLMHLMGIEAIYPKPRLSQPGNPEVKFPYLLRNEKVEHPNQVWCADITYIPVQGSFCYCIAVMDWWSRYVLSWRISNSMDTSFCLEALEEALSKGHPAIFNTDQGSQFTSKIFVECLLQANIRISWDGRGRALDNVFIERLWRSVKWEEVYLHDYQSLVEARSALNNYLKFYNDRRPHQALKYLTPSVVYSGALPPNPREKHPDSRQSLFSGTGHPKKINVIS